ncbi:MAG: ATP-dependent helicase [Nanoarchaeota archaeon]|nr:ATP-dependent helicase [Nanoarchaeota archaeon]
MITTIEQPTSQEELGTILHPYVKEWFFSQFKQFSEPQLYGVMDVHLRNNILISAPTGTGKTLTAFLSIINELVQLADKEQLEDRVYAVYISPLKALSRDVEKNLQEPLAAIKKIAEQQGKKLDIRVGLRTGDTTAAEKAKMLRKTPHILVTTPESLALMLTSFKFAEKLHNVNWVIIDEIHSIAENKRGVHLSLSLERLNHISPYMSRVGLSATVAPIENIARYLVGNNRTCKIANVQHLKKFDIQVMSPLPDLINTTDKKLHDALYAMIDTLVETHKTTLIFTNTRAGTERVVHHLKDRFPKKYTENIAAHHGSLSKQHRHEIENNLREGKLKAVVCSTSLELGIDIGFIDLVICLGSPKSVARLLQRIGRAGHQLHSQVKGRMIVMDRDDLVECSVLLKSAMEKKIDRIHIPQGCLDVLAQQIYGMVIQERWDIEALYNLIKQSYSYEKLTYHDYMEVMKYLAGHYVDLQDRHIYAKIWIDEETKQVGKKGKIARLLYMTNIGTIPDESHVIVKIGDIAIGNIDEAFLEKLKRGEIFVLGGNTYEFLFARGMVAQVRAAPERKPTVPSWFSEMLPLSYDLAVDIQKFRRYMQDQLENKQTKKATLEFIHNYLYVDNNAAEAIYNYFWEQYNYSELPHDKKLLIEYYNEEKKKYVIFHSLYGRRVNDVLSRAVAYAIGKLQKKDVELGFNDNGFFIASDRPIQVLRAFELLNPDQLYQIMERAIEKSEILKRRFRHCAGRALMILREYKGHRKKVGRQQVSSMILLAAVRRISEDFPILKEARREVLEDLMDIHHAIDILKQIKEGTIELKERTTPLPSPFALHLVLQGYTDIMKMEDKLEFLKRMHTMILAKIGKNYPEA